MVTCLTLPVNKKMISLILRAVPRPQDELDVFTGDGLHRLHGAHHELPIRVAPVVAVALVIMMVMVAVDAVALGALAVTRVAVYQSNACYITKFVHYDLLVDRIIHDKS